MPFSAPESFFRRLSVRFQAWRRTRSQLCGGVLALAACWSFNAPAHAQQPLPPAEAMDYTMPFSEASGAASFVQMEPKTVGGYGIKGRIGHETGPGVGRQESLTSFDLSPYVFLSEDGNLFSEGRLFVANNGRVGGTVLAGYRHYIPLLNSVVGGGAGYDGDDHRNAWFQQWSVFGEVMTEWFDIRANAYFPFGNEQQVTAQVFEPGSAQFVNRAGLLPGTNIQFQQRIFTATLMEGQDVMVSLPVPGEFAQNLNLEVSTGIYHYVADDDRIPEAWGWRLRFDADIFERLSHMFLEISDDEAFDTNVVFGIDINYWHKLEHKERLGHSQHQRLADWVRRNRSTVAFTDSALGDPELAINPFTGQPYIALQVNSGALPGGDGRLGTEFNTIQDAINFSALDPDFGTRDIIFVQGGSDFSGAAANVDMTLAADPIQLLGEGPVLNIEVLGLTGGIELPGVTGGAQPILRDTVGPAVNLQTLSRFAGFTISNINGDAIVGNGVGNLQVEEVDITSTIGGGDGISFTNAFGGISIDDVSIANTDGDAFSVNGGTAAIVFRNINTITNATGFAAIIEDAGGSVNALASTITSGGRGILVNGTAPGLSTANVTFGTVSLTNTNAGAAAEAILINNHSGSVSFFNALSIDGNNGDNFVVSNLQSTGSVNALSTVTIANRNAHGILVSDIQEGGGVAGSVTFNGNVDISEPVAGLGLEEGVQFQSASGSLRFLGNLSIDGSNGNGIEISNIANTGTLTGLFQVVGNTTLTAIDGTAFNMDNVAKSNFRVIMNNLDILERTGVGINISNSDFSTAQGVSFLGTTNIIDDDGITPEGVIIFNNLGSVGFNILNVGEDGTPHLAAPGTIASVVVLNNGIPGDANLRTVSFNSLNVFVEDATAVSFINNDNVTVNTGILDATDGRGIEIINSPALLNGRHAVAFESISSTNADFGIFVQDSPGFFGVTGLANVLGSGGTITGATTAAAHFDNTTVVELGFMDINNGGRGVEGFNMLEEFNNVAPRLELLGLQINATAQEAVFMQDVLNFSLQQSTLTNNGTPGLVIDEQLEFIVFTNEFDTDGDGDLDPLTYNVVINNNDFDDAAGTFPLVDMIFIHTDATLPDPVALNLTFTNNGDPPAGLTNVESNRQGAAALHVQWEGTFNANISGNDFILDSTAGSGDNQTAVFLDIDGISDVDVVGNAITGNGLANTGLRFVFDQAANVLIQNNFSLTATGALDPNSGFIFTGEDSTAIDLLFDDPNNVVNITNNLVSFNGTGDDGTGIIFRRIFAPSNVTIQGNSINFLAPGVLPGLNRGIIFSDVRGTINLFGTTDNFIGPLNAVTVLQDFFFNGTANGGILINGVRRP